MLQIVLLAVLFVLLCAGAIALFGAAFLSSIKIIPAAMYGVTELFGGRGRVLRERRRPHFVIPFFEKVNLISMVRDSISVPFEFFTYSEYSEEEGKQGKVGSPRIKIIGELVVQWRPDPNLMTHDGHNKFYEFVVQHAGKGQDAEGVVAEGMKERITSVLGGIISQSDPDHLLNNIKAVNRYINCVLRADQPPHTKPSDFAGENKKYKEMHDEIESMQKRIDFYRECSALIEAQLRERRMSKEKITKSEAENSEVEMIYGIEVLDVGIKKFEVSSETAKAFELEKQMREQLKAGEREVATIENWAGRLDKLPKSALDSTLALRGKAQKHIIALEGVSVSPLIGLLTPLIEVVKSVLEKKGGDSSAHPRS